MMRFRTVYLWPVLFLLVMPEVARCENTGIAWPEAVARLAAERSKAETCVAMLKAYGDSTQIAQGQLDYANSKANIDSVISGLTVVLAQNGQPESLPTLESKLELGTAGLAEFCKAVGSLLPSTAGEKNVFADIVKIAIEPVLKSLSEGVAAIYTNHRNDNALIRTTIQTQLEAAKWPEFASIKAVR
jgi:hypothetical protein